MFFQQPAPQQMQVQVPPGLGPGATFAVQTPNGLVQVQVPQGVVGGMNMMIAVPSQPVQVVQAPQPMVMVQQVQPQIVQQQQTPPSPAKKTPEPVKKKKGASGQSIYKFNLNSTGENGEGCCDASASPVGQFTQKGAAGLPAELKDIISPESWELMVPKWAEWQTKVGPCIVPAQETCCMYTGGCCCWCTACLMMQLSARDAWEVEQGKQINDMLEQYEVKLTWEKGGACPDLPCCVKNYANFVWI